MIVSAPPRCSTEATNWRETGESTSPPSKEGQPFSPVRVASLPKRARCAEKIIEVRTTRLAGTGAVRRGVLKPVGGYLASAWIQVMTSGRRYVDHSYGRPGLRESSWKASGVLRHHRGRRVSEQREHALIHGAPLPGVTGPAPPLCDVVESGRFCRSADLPICRSPR
jgi:hypothetical protein